MKIVDQLNQEFNFNKPPKRIISLVPSQTELLVDLGLESNIVGITKFCVHPRGLRKKKEIIGGTKKVNIEIIKLLQPDIIIGNKEENTKEIISELRNIAPVWVSDIINFEDCLTMISKLGNLFVKQKKANELIKSINSEKELFLNFINKRKPVKVAYLIWKNPYMIAGVNTFINELLKINKFENFVTEPNSRYPEIQLNDLKKADLVLLSSEPFPFKENDVETISKELKTKVILVNGEYFSWYGSRLRKAFNYFKNLPIN